MVGFDWAELESLHDAGGLFVFPLDGDKLGMAWIFIGTGSDTQGPLTAAAKYFGEQGFRSKTEKQSGATLTTLTPPADRNDESPRVLFAAPGIYGVANSPAAADALLHVTRDNSLGDVPSWQQMVVAGTDVASLPGDVRLLIRPMELWELVSTSKPESNAPPSTTEEGASEKTTTDPMASSRQVGFDAIQALAGRISFTASSQRDWEIAVRMEVPPPYEKALRMLDMPPGPMPELPEYIAADITSVTFWRWNFSQAMKGFGNLFDEANEPGPDGVGLFEDMLDGLRDDPEGVQVDLRREVFEQLGPEILNITDRQGPKTEILPHGDRTLYVAQVRDVPIVAGALTRFYKGDDRVRHERKGGYDIWTVPEGASLFVEGESDSVVSVRALALGEGRMLFGTDEGLLRSTLAGGPRSELLKDQTAWSGMWKSMRDRAGAAGALWAMARLDDVLAPSYAQATSEPPNDEDDGSQGGPLSGLWRILLFGDASQNANVPTSAAPAFDRLRPSLPPASITFSPDGESWNVTITPCAARNRFPVWLDFFPPSRYCFC